MKKGFKHSEETKRKIGIAHQGQKRSEWMKSRMRKPHLAARGKKPKNFNTLHTPEMNKKRGLIMSKVLMGHNADYMTGEKNFNWKGGISKKPGYDGFMSKRRKLRKLENGGSHTFGEWETLKKQYNLICLSCQLTEPFENQKYKLLTEDHIIPISRGGSDNIENIQPLCFSCNSKKQAKMIKFNIVEN